MPGSGGAVIFPQGGSIMLHPWGGEATAVAVDRAAAAGAGGAPLLDPKPSPMGGMVAFVQDCEVYVARVEAAGGGAALPPAQHLPAAPKAAAASASASAAAGVALEEGSVEGWDVFAANEKLFGVKVGELSAAESASYGLRAIKQEDFTAAQLAAADAIAREITSSKQAGWRGGSRE